MPTRAAGLAALGLIAALGAAGLTGCAGPTPSSPVITPPTSASATLVAPSSRTVLGTPGQLCADLARAATTTAQLPASTATSYVAAMISAWGLGRNGGDNPFVSADAVTVAACPAVRARVLAVPGTPDLATTGTGALHDLSTHQPR